MAFVKHSYLLHPCHPCHNLRIPYQIPISNWKVLTMPSLRIVVCLEFCLGYNWRFLFVSFRTRVFFFVYLWWLLPNEENSFHGFQTPISYLFDIASDIHARERSSTSLRIQFSSIYRGKRFATCINLRFVSRVSLTSWNRSFCLD